METNFAVEATWCPFMPQIDIFNQAINNINVLCSLANTKEDWKRLVTPNPDDWKWNDADKQKARKEIWGY